MTAADGSLRLETVSRHFGGVVAVADVSFTVPSGEIVGLIGPNGAGKSTLVNLVTGLLRLTTGRILLGDADISTAEAPQIARAGIARTFQTVRLLKDESVLDNVAIGFHAQLRSPLAARLLALPAALAEDRAIRKKAWEILERFDMAGFAHVPAGTLSYGHQRRVEMMRTLALRPRIILLDEPVAGMNDVEADALGRVFQSIAREGIGILLIEHNMRFVMSLCGRIIAAGTPAEIRSDPAVIAAYLGS